MNLFLDEGLESATGDATGIASGDQPEICPLGYRIGANGITIPWDSAIELGEWGEVKDTTIAINMRTLIRNAHGSFEREGVPQANLAERVREDILLIKEYFRDVHNSAVHIYAIDYDRTYVSKMTNFKLPRTEKQKDEAIMYKNMLKELSLSIDKWHASRVLFSGDYIISNYIYDMAEAQSHVKLIETHTGAIKSRSELNSKLNLNDAETMVVPFTKMTYLLYGDKVLLHKQTGVTRKLLDVLLAAEITPLSTETRLSMAVKNRDPILHRILRKFTNG